MQHNLYYFEQDDINTHSVYLQATAPSSIINSVMIAAERWRFIASDAYPMHVKIHKRMMPGCLLCMKQSKSKMICTNLHAHILIDMKYIARPRLCDSGCQCQKLP